ncbi:phage capsid protein [Candidatus Liberibacter solanacearum]|nr:hypothetical protein [Candidatus Liberibacter solanacearum]
MQLQFSVVCRTKAILEGMLGKSHIFDSCFSPDNIIPSVPKNDFCSTFITQIITARNVFKDRFIDVDLEEIYVLVPFELWLSLFSPENATLKDYVNHESFRTGIIEALPGMRFIVMDKVPGSDFFPTGTEFQD